MKGDHNEINHVREVLFPVLPTTIYRRKKTFFDDFVIVSRITLSLNR